MRVVVDTNVVAYLVLGTEPYAREVRQFWDVVSQPIAPVLWEAELANVVWMAIRSGILPPEEGPRKLGLAARLHVHSIPTRGLWRGALARSIRSGVAVYDTFFVELAIRDGIALATFDKRLLEVFPQTAKRPSGIRF